MMKLKKYFARCDKGPYLNLNEDVICTDLENSLYFILDGFGGAGIGDNAVNLLRTQIKSFYVKVTEDINATMPFHYDFNLNVEMNALINSIICSHRLLLKKNGSKKISMKAGASGAFFCQSDNILNYISIGNCSLYLYRENRLFSLNPYLDDFNLIEGQGVKIPKNAFGMYFHLGYCPGEVKIKKNDQFLLMSDGADGLLNDEELRVLIEAHNGDLEALTLAVFEKNNKKGNRDNQSVIALKY